MMIDLFAGTIPTLAPPARSEKKPDTQYVRPVEGSQESQNSHLDIDRERLATQKRGGDPLGQNPSGSATYNARGNLTEKDPFKNCTPPKQGPIDLTV
jgi:hypothetical protein